MFARKDRSPRQPFTSRSKAAVDRAAAKMLEPLEQRRMMSMTSIGGGGPVVSPMPSMDTSGSSFYALSLLSVEGTPGDDQIFVQDVNGTIQAYVNGYLQASMADWFCTSITAHGRAGNDRITVADNVTVRGYLYGDDGMDTLTGSASASEDIRGGNGWDHVDYTQRWQNLNITLDDVRNDGQANEQDNVHTDIEVVSGGYGNDSITGSANNDTLWGGNWGNDTLDGGLGNDSLNGGNGNDLLMGNDGDDTFNGGAGSDTMIGGTGTDTVSYEDAFTPVTVSLDWSANDGEGGENDLVLPDVENVLGGWGNDTITGSSADNVLFGGAGDDVIRGMDGNDTMEGSLGNDSIFGGDGDDSMSGGVGDDTLVSIGGGQADSLSGGAGFDSFWADAQDTFSQWDWNESVSGHIHQVYSFADYHFSNGPTVPITRDLDGQNFPDPVGGMNYASFANNPLFNTGGPSKDDIFQQKLGDCYFMATISSIAKINPDKIRQSVVDLGDGTYAVQFWNNGSPVFVRVDGDLPRDGSNNLIYGGLGSGNCLWGAIMEKAWAYYRHNDSDYQSIVGGWPDQAYSALGICSSTQSTFAYTFSNQPDQLWNYVTNELALGKSVVACTYGSTSTLVKSHCYEVDSTYIDGNNVRHLVLRNPWGFNTDVTAAQFLADVSQVDSAFV
ncbi:MAG TPA: C2 family cysteine protease [Tepidisphaeraceae bacterium]